MVIRAQASQQLAFQPRRGEHGWDPVPQCRGGVEERRNCSKRMGAMISWYICKSQSSETVSAPSTRTRPIYKRANNPRLLLIARLGRSGSITQLELLAVRLLLLLRGKFALLGGCQLHQE
jgi:hypothetical protein